MANGIIRFTRLRTNKLLPLFIDTALFRHTLATQLLAAGQPLKAIADVLGHASTQPTYGYTRVEVASLRSVAISAEEVIR